jgi:choline dehydrogenase-like flavoprotein
MMQRMLPPKVIPHRLYGPRSRAWARSLIGAAFQIGALQRFADRLFGVIVILGKPKSRGTLRLRSADAGDQALIDPGYYSDPEDLETMVRGVRLARAIGGSNDLSAWSPRELMPGRRARSEAAIRRYVERNTITTYHFAGTCRMGQHEADAVDPELRLRGARGLRVADASVIPWTPVSALNAPSMLIGYRAARLIEAESSR